MNSPECTNSSQSPEILNDWNITKLAILYANVFKGPPWNEAIRCNTCDNFGPDILKLNSTCECGGIFQEAYPTETTKKYIQNEMKKNNSRLITYSEKEKLIAFGWGYELTGQQLANEKWRTSDMREAMLKIINKKIQSVNSSLFYISEVGVDPNERTKGIATRVIQQLINCTNLPIIYRTNCESPMMVIGNNLGFTQIQGPEVQINKTMKKIYTTNIILDTYDTENPARVLLFKEI